MRKDAEQVYAQLLATALGIARRRAQTPMDAEDDAQSGLVDYLEHSEAGDVDLAHLKTYVWRAQRSRQHKHGALRQWSATDTERTEALDAEAIERVEAHLGAGQLQVLRDSGPVPGGAGGAERSRRYRARRRAVQAALGVEGELGEGCASWAGSIVAVARHQATQEQQANLLAHIESCTSCADVLEDRRALAYRWRLGALVPPVFVTGRHLFRRAGEWAHSHVAVSAAVGLAGAGALTAALVIPVKTPPPHRVTVVVAPTTTTTTTAPPEATTLPEATTTTTTTTAPPAPPPQPVPTSTTAPAPAPVVVAPTPTTTAPPVYHLSASGTPSVSGTTATLTITAHASAGSAPDPDTTVTATAPRCTSASAPTAPSGTATLVLYCPLTAPPVTVTVSDTRGITTSFVVG